MTDRNQFRNAVISSFSFPFVNPNFVLISQKERAKYASKRLASGSHKKPCLIEHTNNNTTSTSSGYKIVDSRVGCNHLICNQREWNNFPNKTPLKYRTLQ